MVLPIAIYSPLFSLIFFTHCNTFCIVKKYTFCTQDNSSTDRLNIRLVAVQILLTIENSLLLQRYRLQM